MTLSWKKTILLIEPKKLGKERYIKTKGHWVNMEQFCKSSQKELEREWYAKKQMALDWDGIVLLIKPKKLERV